MLQPKYRSGSGKETRMQKQMKILGSKDARKKPLTYKRRAAHTIMNQSLLSRRV